MIQYITYADCVYYVHVFYHVSFSKFQHEIIRRYTAAEFSKSSFVSRSGSVRATSVVWRSIWRTDKAESPSFQPARGLLSQCKRGSLIKTQKHPCKRGGRILPNCDYAAKTVAPTSGTLAKCIGASSTAQGRFLQATVFMHVPRASSCPLTNSSRPAGGGELKFRYCSVKR